jgi:uncharacterized protein (DUF58 family)
LKSMKFLSKKLSKKSVRQVERRLNLRIFPILIVILVILYVLTNFRGWLVFFIGTAGAWLIAWLWIHSLERNLWIERKINYAWATVGESVPEQVRLINHGWLPAIWVEITDDTASLESPLRMVSDVSAHTSRNRNLSHLFKRRGLYTLGPTHLRCGDPFGIYTLSMTDQHASTILVTPPILPLSRLHIPSGGWSGDERIRRGYVERNISDAGLRNYVPGDSLRRIHWHASAHFDALIVRQLDAATSRDWWIFVDLDSSVQAGIGQHSTLELSIVLAASLAVRGLKEYRRVGLVLAGPKFIRLEPGSDPSQGWRILRALAIATAGEHSLADLIQQSHFTSAATDILITPSTSPAWVAAADRHRKGGNIITLLSDPADFGNPVDQGKVITALANSRIPYIRMPGSLLEEAYSPNNRAEGKRINGGDTLRRYLQQGRQVWQSMD